jgi:CspA family cold shock protein
MEEHTGTVKWFSRRKGYGFIQPDGAEDDVFVHYTAIIGEGFRNLDEGERVQFAIEDTPKGPQAVNVVQLGAEALPEEALPEEGQEEEALPEEEQEEEALPEEEQEEEALPEEEQEEDSGWGV